MQRVSDAFMPPLVRDWLYTEYFKVGPTPVNGWSGIHAVTGAALGWLPLYDAVLLHSLWEGFQFLAGDNTFDNESYIDIGLDTLFFSVGHQTAVFLSS